MNSSTEKRIQALEVALNNESRERDFYLRHAERTSNAFGKLMFQSIAQDENEHYQKILELHKQLKEQGKWPETIPLKVKGVDMNAILKKVVASVDTSAEVDADDMEAVKIAIDFESKGEKFYGDLRDSVDDPVEKEFYGMLANMERMKEKHHLDGG